MVPRSLRWVLSACLFMSAAAAASDLFVGDWKLNPSKSTLTDKMTVTSAGGNKYIFDFGGGPETIVVDGTDQPTKLYGGDSLSVASAGGTWKVVRKKDGHAMISAVWTLSKDANTLTDHFTGVNADGSPFTLHYTYKRRAAGEGYAGTWISTKLDTVNFAPGLQIRAFEEKGLAFIDPSSQIMGNMSFAASLVRKVDDRTLELMRKKSDGGLSAILQLKLSHDLKTLVITPPSVSPDEPHILAFDRQSMLPRIGAS